MGHRWKQSNQQENTRERREVTRNERIPKKKIPMLVEEHFV